MVQLNFYDDWVSYIRSYGENKYKLNLRNLDDEQAVLACFNAKHERIEMKPRHLVKPDNFTCPPGVKLGWEYLKKTIENGGDLNCHLSRNIKKPKKNDGLLNDWGIKHFHLGCKSSLRRDLGFIERTGPLAFAWVDDTTFYALGIYGHDSWVNEELLEIIHTNWPDLLKPYKAKGMSGATLSKKERQTLRKRNVNSCFTAKDGSVYFPPGGGVLSSGLQIRCRWRYDQAHARLGELEQAVEKNWTSILERAIEQRRGVDFDDLGSVKLIVRKDCLALSWQDGQILLGFGCDLSMQTFKLCSLDY